MAGGVKQATRFESFWSGPDMEFGKRALVDVAGRPREAGASGVMRVHCAPRSRKQFQPSGRVSLDTRDGRQYAVRRQARATGTRDGRSAEIDHATDSRGDSTNQR